MSINQSIDQLVVRLQRRDLISSRQTALETAQLLYRFVGSARYNSIEQLLDQIKAVGRRLVAANSKELAVGNIVRKVLRLIREEYRAACLSQLQQSSAAILAEGSGTVSSPFELSLPPQSAESVSTGSGGGSGKNNKAQAQAAGGGGTSGNDSIPGTPMPPTPGIHVPSNHFLSDEFSRLSVGGGSVGSGNGSTTSGGKSPYFDRPTRTVQSPPDLPSNDLISPSAPHSPISRSQPQLRSVSGPSTPSSATSRPKPAHTQTSLSTFVQMRHTRAQLERAGSTNAIFGPGGLGGVTAGMEGSLMTPALMTGGLNMGFNQFFDALFATPPGTAGTMNTGNGSDNPNEPPPNLNTFSSPHRNSFPGLTPLPNIPNLTQSPTPSIPAPQSQTSGQNNVFARQQKEQMDAISKKAIGLKPVLVDAIREVVDEIETTHETCAKGAREHIHSSEIILTVGYSKTVEAFLKNASRDRNFTVICAETAPSRLGVTMAKALAKHNIPTVLIPDSAIYAVMPRVTKLLLGAHSVLANGGMFTISGSLLAALSARAHSTPVVVVAGQYKFAPAWNLYNDSAGLDFGDPGAVLSFEEGEFLDKVEVENPYYDYVKPELINLFVTNEGDHAPAYIYKLVNEAYDEADAEL